MDDHAEDPIAEFGKIHYEVAALFLQKVDASVQMGHRRSFGLRLEL